MLIRFVYLIILLLILPSCGYQKFSRNQVAKNIKQSIFIQIPENPLVFDNLSSIFYKSLFMTYKKLGYNLSDNTYNSFVLKTKIKSLEPVEKFISQDLLLYNIKLSIKVNCKLFDANRKLIIQKEMECFRLVSYPKDPIQNSKFLDYEYKKLMDRLSLKIERFFRKYFLSYNNKY